MNCVDAVKILYDYDVLNCVQDYLLNKDLYQKTGNQMYLNELNYIEKDLDQFFDIGEFELNMLSSVEFIRKYFANKQKVRNRLKDRINLFLSKVDEDKSVYFVTLTLRDEYLKGRDYEIIRKDIRKFVKLFCPYFILNKDYGSTNFRLHFHGVVVLYNVDLATFQEQYYKKFGFQKCDCCNTNSRLLSAYIEKLSFHALKTSTKKEYREHVIYSRLPKEESRKLGLNAKYNSIKNSLYSKRFY